MQNILFSFLAIAIALGGLWYHDVRHPPEEQANEREAKRKNGEIKGGSADQSQEQPVAVQLP